jgi:S1-C subfamily serine protease
MWTAVAAEPPLERALVSVADRATAAVVHLRVEQESEFTPPLRELLQDYDAALPERKRAPQDVSGSGVIVDPSGRILTNHHVVESADRVVVVLQDQRRIPGHVVGSDPRTDVAIVQLDAPGPYPWLPLGDSDAIRVGQPVLAVGSPFDFQSSVSLGVVSALGRRGMGPWNIQDFIQTDAAVNPGSSGGPLVDLDGRVIGLNTAIYAPGVEQSSGVSFAVPSNLVARVAEDLVGLGRVRRPWVGVLAVTVDAVDGDGTRSGAEVTSVVAGSPAERAGVRRGDVIVSVDGVPVLSASGLRSGLVSRAVGREVAVEVVREDQARTFAVTPVEVVVSRPAVDDLQVVWRGWGGLVLAEPTSELLHRVGLPYARGLIVLEASPSAARAGIVAGDVVTRVAATPTLDLASLDALADRAGTFVVVEVARDGGVFSTLLQGT